MRIATLLIVSVALLLGRSPAAAQSDEGTSQASPGDDSTPAVVQQDSPADTPRTPDVTTPNSAPAADLPPIQAGPRVPIPVLTTQPITLQGRPGLGSATGSLAGGSAQWFQFQCATLCNNAIDIH